MNDGRFALLALILAPMFATMRRGDRRRPRPRQPPTPAANAEAIERGAYLVRSHGLQRLPHALEDGPEGSGAGHDARAHRPPEDIVMPPPPALERPVGHGRARATNTAWAGPWGVSFTANLTPDKETGLGDWTEEMFIKTMRTGRHQGKGRPILPPMPYQIVGTLTDEDLKAVFAYLQSLPPCTTRCRRRSIRRRTGPKR